MNRLVAPAPVAYLALALAAACDPGLTDDTPEAASGAQVTEAVAWDVSPPLRVMAGAASAGPVESDAVTPPLVSFEGLGVGFPLVAAPGDPSGDIGPNHYVQVVNFAARVHDRTGATVLGPFLTSSVWAGFGGGCEVENAGYASVRYDRLAGRWVITQYAHNNLNGPFLQCVAVSATGDPTGSYHRYSFQYAAYHDFARIAVWPDAYYFTYNMYPGLVFGGAKVCAVDRARMLAGLSATQQCFDTTTDYMFLLAADYEGGMVPPVGAPAPVLALGSADVTNDDLASWSFHVDWADPTSSTFTGPTAIPVASYTRMCNGATNCVPQVGTANLLAGQDRALMSRLAYRRFADHEALFATHSVLAAAGTGGMRWYELRDPSAGVPVLFQQGTVSTANNYRWMGALAVDKMGGVGLAYSHSSTGMFPRLSYTGRVAGDPPGTMPQGEEVLVNGLGAQTSPNRWGDWSMMSVDPLDDCTFWFTGQYPGPTGGYNWRTRIGSFRVSTCTTDFPPTTAITSPIAGSLLAGTVAIEATAADDFGLNRVEFRRNGVLIGSDTTPPYGINWDTTSVADGSHSLRSRAFDSIGQAVSSSPVNVTVDNPGGVDLTPPTTSLHLPAPGSTVSGTIRVAAKALDAVGVDRVEFYAGAVLIGTDTAGPYFVNWNTNGVADGPYNLTSRAFDAAGNSATSAVVPITVHNDIVTTSLLFNGGFETGAFAPRWTSSGQVSVDTTVFKSGTRSARIGSTTAVAGDHAIGQSFTVPLTGATTLRFWVRLHCEFDSVAYDQQEALLLDPSGGEVAVLFRTCDYQPTWTLQVVDLTPYAGQTLTLSFRTHDDGYAFDPTWFYVDAITVKNVL
jgi:hypothetical protein